MAERGQAAGGEDPQGVQGQGKGDAPARPGARRAGASDRGRRAAEGPDVRETSCASKAEENAASPPAGAAQSARASTACSSTLAPSSQASGEAYSASLWLMPSLHGTKIIAVGTTRAM